MKRIIALLFLLASTAVLAQPYPSKPIRMVVGFVAGGPTDALARIVALRLSGALGQQVVVENRGGADGIIGADVVAKSTPDGYTIFFASAGHAINASLYAKVPYRTVEDFEPITRVGESPNIIAVTPSLPAKDLRELISLAKAKPGELNYGATSSPTHLATELLASSAGIKLTRVPYKGAAPAMQALMAGDVQIVLSGIGTMLPQAKAGRIKALAVTGAERSPLAPELPTVVESGIKYVATTWYGLLAPAGTPRPVIDRLNQAARTALDDPATKAQLAPQGVVLQLSTPEEFGAFLRSEVATWGKVVQ
ncbi:MAG TPA: tripartite tricarboxylate transporter substrate binding protein, partial [Burkholderiales bacterium]|nr:tripartite tricarboxylate transporter substrate binding protein [Burkholderiales bacterium]